MDSEPSPKRRGPADYVRSGGDLTKQLLERHDPFWAPQLVVASAIALDLSLPERLTLGPSWLLPSVEAVLLAGLLIASPNPKLGRSTYWAASQAMSRPPGTPPLPRSPCAAVAGAP